MAKRDVKAIEFTCDDCGRSHLQKKAHDGDLIYGYRGHVSEVTERGGNGAEWFCCLECDPGVAIRNALREAAS